MLQQLKQLRITYWTARKAAFGLVLLASFAEPDAARSESHFGGLSLEELGNVPAIASSKSATQVFDAPTGSFVFDAEAIQNLPVDSIPEMLRYAPGVHIIRPSNGIWGLGMRGINSRFFNRVTFTVDEQDVYGTIFSGLFGNQHDLLLDDVASVEVAYGPGGGTWDNNAVNGTVNVLMKTAFETEGALLETQIGTESRGLAARIGWAIDDKTSARVFAKVGERDSSLTRFDYSNKWDTARAGFRLDHRPSSRDLLSFSSEIFYSNLGYAYNLADFDTGALVFQADRELLRGASSQVKWTRNNANGSAYSVRNWVTYSDLKAPYATFDIATAGIEGRARIPIGERHELSLNLGGAYDEENTRSTLASDFTSDFLSNSSLYSGFQYDWKIAPDSISLSLGADARYDEKSDTTTVSPNARFIFELSDSDRLWLSYSRANRVQPVSLSVIESLRSGKVVDNPLVIPAGETNIVVDRNLTNAVSARELNSETLDAFEAGYRAIFAEEKGTLSLNGFYYRYDDIAARIATSAAPRLAVESPFLDIQGAYTNLLEGEAYGFEAHLNWQFTPALSATASYSRLVDSFDPLLESTNPVVADSIQFSLDEFDHSTPGHMATINLSADLAENWNLQTALRYSSGYDFAKGYQPAVFQLDSRLSWRTSETLRLSLVGRNLLDPYTQEARLKDFFGHWTELKREVYLEISAEF